MLNTSIGETDAELKTSLIQRTNRIIRSYIYIYTNMISTAKTHVALTHRSKICKTIKNERPRQVEQPYVCQCDQRNGVRLLNTSRKTSNVYLYNSTIPLHYNPRLVCGFGLGLMALARCTSHRAASFMILVKSFCTSHRAARNNIDCYIVDVCFCLFAQRCNPSWDSLSKDSLRPEVDSAKLAYSLLPSLRSSSDIWL